MKLPDIFHETPMDPRAGAAVGGRAVRSRRRQMHESGRERAEAVQPAGGGAGAGAPHPLYTAGSEMTGPCA